MRESNTENGSTSPASFSSHAQSVLAALCARVPGSVKSTAILLALYILCILCVARVFVSSSQPLSIGNFTAIGALCCLFAASIICSFVVACFPCSHNPYGGHCAGALWARRWLVVGSILMVIACTVVYSVQLTHIGVVLGILVVLYGLIVSLVGYQMAVNSVQWLSPCERPGSSCGNHAGSIDAEGQRLNVLRFVRERLWFWILAIGLYGVLGAFVCEQLVSGRPAHSLLALVSEFLRSYSGSVFGVVLTSFLTDFVVMLFHHLEDVHYDMVNIQKVVKNVPRQLDAAVQTNKTTLTAMEQNNKATLTEMTKIHKSIVECMDYVETQGVFAAGLKGCGDEAIVNLMKDAVRDPVDKLRKRIQRVGSHYLKQATTEIDAKQVYARTFLASEFMRKLVDSVGTERNSAERPNTVQANFGIMSGIVDEIYVHAEKICEKHDVKIDGDKELVLFTTLTLKLDHYLNAANLAGNLSSVALDWDRVRWKTRRLAYEYNSALQNGAQSHLGHVWMLHTSAYPITFQRCCLTIKEGDATDSKAIKRNEISVTSEWTAVATLPMSDQLKPIYMDDGAGRALNAATELGYIVTDKDRSQYGNHVKFFDKLLPEIEDFVSVPYPDKSFTNKNAIDVFKSLYHPQLADFSQIELNDEHIHNMFFTKIENSDPIASPMAQAFSDPDWCNLREKIKNKSQSPTTSSDWADIFFNHHIPIDLFAIGVRSKKVKGNTQPNRKTNWLCCLGAYIGGDFSDLMLSWHDPTTDALHLTPTFGNTENSPAASTQQYSWNAITGFLDYLQILADKTKPGQPDEGVSTPHVVGTRTLDDLYNEFPYGPAGSVVSEIASRYVRAVAGQQLSGGSKIKTLELGAAYGRDSINLAAGLSDCNIDITAVDMYSSHQERFDKLINLHIGGVAKQSHLGTCIFRCEDITNEAFWSNLEQQGGKYHLIHSYHVLHYLDAPLLKNLFTNCHKVLAPHGVMIHAFLSDRTSLSSAALCDLDNEAKFREKQVEIVKHDGETVRQLVVNAGFFSLTKKDKLAGDIVCGLYHCRVVELHKITDEIGQSVLNLHTHPVWILIAKKEDITTP